MTYDQQQFSDFYRLWEDELMDGQHYSPDWAQYRTPAAIKLVREKALSYGGLPAISAFMRAFEELKASGVIRPVRAARPVEKDFSLSREEYEAIPASDVVRRYRSEPDFKSAVDSLIAKGLI